MNKSIYDKVIAAGIEHDNHCSDLYIPVNEETRKLVNEYEHKCNVTTFMCNVTKVPWFDIPFAYEPYWKRADKIVETWAAGVYRTT